MADNAMARLTFLITFFLIAFALLMVLLLVLKISQYFLRRRLRRLISRDSQHDLVGRQAIVVRTIRQSRPGYISIDYQQNIYSFKAISDQKILPGAQVTITSVMPDGFHVSCLKEDQNTKAFSEQEHSTLEKTVVQDINVDLSMIDNKAYSRIDSKDMTESGKNQNLKADRPATPESDSEAVKFS